VSMAGHADMRDLQCSPAHVSECTQNEQIGACDADPREKSQPRPGFTGRTVCRGLR
jgi:hypothetical protein